MSVGELEFPSNNLLLHTYINGLQYISFASNLFFLYSVTQEVIHKVSIVQKLEFVLVLNVQRRLKYFSSFNRINHVGYDQRFFCDNERQ
jgi:hypothetical protein